MILKTKNVGINIVPKLLRKIFIYPTDTIYGIGCNAENKKLVKEIRNIKASYTKAFSIIAPNKEYILDNFITTKKEIKKYLPGPYTLLLKKKNPKFLLHVSQNEFIGIRIPAHAFTKILQKTKKPIVTTSVNLTGQKPANQIKEIDKKILKKIDLIIDYGKLSGKPSTLIKNSKEIKR